MDVKSFLDRTHRSKADLLRELGLDPKSSLISSYIAGRSNPSFEVCVKLIKLGITPLELFGEEIDRMFREYYSKNLPDSVDNPDFRKGLDIGSKPLTRDEAIALFKELQANKNV